MDTSLFFAHRLSKNEQVYGIGYLLFQIFLLPSLLGALNSLLPAPLPQSEINALYFLVNFIAVAVILRSYWMQLFSLLPESLFQVLVVAIPGFFLYWLLNLFVSQIITAIEPAFFNINDQAMHTLIAENYPLMFIGTVILVPITEECLYRALLFRGLYDRSAALAWAVSILGFAAMHIVRYVGVYEPATLLLCFLQYLPAGICLAGAYRLSGSLLSPILIHAAVNLIGMMTLR